MTNPTGSTTRRETVLVLGGTGKTGRRVAERLGARGIPVRIGSRSGTPPFDWEDRTTWVPVLQGVAAVYVAYAPDLAVPGAVEAIREFTGLAVRSGAHRLVLLSGRGEEEAQRAEAEVQRSGVDWTIVRCSWFFQNFSESFMREALVAGELALPVSDMSEPFVDADDVADVATAALTEDRHAGLIYEVTGPRLLNFARAVAEIGEAVGRPMRLVRIPVAAFERGMLGQGVPREAVGLMVYLFATVLDGRNACLAGGVFQALGRRPRDFAEFARRAAASGAWSPEGRRMKA